MTVDCCTPRSERSRGYIELTPMPPKFAYNVQIDENLPSKEKCPWLIMNLDKINNAGAEENLRTPKRKEIRRDINVAGKEEEQHKEDLLTVVEGVFDEASLPEKFAEWNYDEQRRWVTEKGSKELLALPDTLSYIIPSLSRSGDCGRASTDVPDWLDMEKFRRGQKFAIDHMLGLFYANILSLYLIFSFEDGLKSLILSQKSHTPYLAFKRYLSTARRVRNWYLDDPWTVGSTAHKDIQIVRKMHLSIRRHLCKLKDQEIDAAAKITNAWCPMGNLIKQDFRFSHPDENIQSHPYKRLRNSPRKPKGFNQAEMASTQFAFMGLIILYPKSFGVHHATEEDLGSFCHVWRGIGYLLGMEDEYNFCNGSLEEVRQRARDFIEVWVKSNLRDITPEWEHMTRCVVEGTRYYFTGTTFTLGLLYLTDLLKLSMPGFSLKIDFLTRLLHIGNKFFFHYLTRLPRIHTYCNRFINRAIDKALDFCPQTHSVLEQKSAGTLFDFPVS